MKGRLRELKYEQLRAGALYRSQRGQGLEEMRRDIEYC